MSSSSGWKTRWHPDDRVLVRSQEFVDVGNLVTGYEMGYLPTISEKKLVFVRTGSSEHEIDKHPLRFC